MSAQGSNLDLTPIWISLKTASITIVITFILGLLAAWWIYSRKSEALKMVFDGIFTFLVDDLWRKSTYRKNFYECIWHSHRI